ncbi:MAG: hypothetical protein K6B38_10825 [Ruminococcus sp.]|nr:hypothetical protein [Ruminococcus sp.]
MHKTTVILREMSADEQIREEACHREKRLHDEATALNHARKEGIEEGIEKGRAEGIASLAEAMRKKGYTEKQIKDLLGEL